MSQRIVIKTSTHWENSKSSSFAEKTTRFCDVQVLVKPEEPGGGADERHLLHPLPPAPSLPLHFHFCPAGHAGTEATTSSNPFSNEVVSIILVTVIML
jgi:hypothetical protein